MAEQVVNLFVLYKIIRELSTPFKETKAFELGLIDEKGKLLKRPKTKKEKPGSLLVSKEAKSSTACGMLGPESPKEDGFGRSNRGRVCKTQR